MNHLADRIQVIFGPLCILGMVRAMNVMDRLTDPSQPATDVGRASSAEFHVPLVCSVFSLTCGFLAYESNKKFTSSAAGRAESAHGRIAFFTYSSVVAILLMYLFSTSLAAIGLWLASYGLLSFVNAGWNYHTVSAERRGPHVWTNAVVGFVALAGLVVLSFAEFLAPWFFYPFLVAIFGLKYWQRGKPREWKGPATDRRANGG